MPAKRSALDHHRGYELIYRYFERTLIHERRYQYFGQDQSAFTFSDFRQPTNHYFANQLRNIRHFGLPQSKPGSFPITDFGFQRTGIYMDHLRLCPDCGTFYRSETTYLFDAIRQQQKPFRLAISALIEARKHVPEFVVAACGATPTCEERRREQTPKGPSYEEKLLLISRQLTARRRKSVYLIQAGKAYKIGIASNVHARIAALQPACPHRIILIKTWRTKNPRGCEKLLHAQFRAYRLQNEWFALPGNVVTDLAQIDRLSLSDLVNSEASLPFDAAF